jgi:hypothetical protein
MRGLATRTFQLSLVSAIVLSGCLGAEPDQGSDSQALTMDPGSDSKVATTDIATKSAQGAQGANGAAGSESSTSSQASEATSTCGSPVFEPNSVITDGACKGWINTQRRDSECKWFAQGLVESWNGTTCKMYLLRLHNSTFTRVSGTHTVTSSKTNTGYYYDDSGYNAFVCISNQTLGHDFICGAGI